MDTARTSSSGYWYGNDQARLTSVRVLEALRTYRTAEKAVRRRTGESMGMGEKDLQALRHLLRAGRTATPMTPRMLASKLDISSASTTALLDRLVRSGHVARRPHPTDRRSLIIVATRETDREVRTTLGAMHDRMLDAAARLSPEQAETVIGFLNEMADAIDPHETPNQPPQS